MTTRIKNTLKRLLRPLKRRQKYSRRQFGAIGRETRIGPGCTLVPRNMFLADHVMIQNGVNFVSDTGRLKVGRYSVISTQCIIIPGTHLPAVGIPFYYQAANHIADADSTIVIEEDCWIGAGCILLMKSRIGRGAIIAAGSTVTKPIPPYAVAAGNPARIMAVKFTKEEIIRHEQALYPPEERLSAEEIDILFQTHFIGVKTLQSIPDADLGVHFDRQTQQIKCQQPQK